MVISLDSPVPRTLGPDSMGIGYPDNTQHTPCVGCVLLRHESCKQCGKVTIGAAECRFSCPTCLEHKLNSRFCCKACFEQAWKTHREKHGKPTSKNMLQTVAQSLSPSIVSKLNLMEGRYDERTWSLLSCFTISNTLLHIQNSLYEVTQLRKPIMFKSLLQVWMHSFEKAVKKGQNMNGPCEAVSISEGVTVLRGKIRKSLSGALRSALPQLLDQHFITSNGKPLKENDRERILRDQPDEVAAQYLGHVSDEVASLFTAIVRMCRCAEPVCESPEQMLDFCLSLLHFNRNALTIAISMTIVKDPASDRIGALLDVEPNVGSGEDQLCELVAHLVLPISEASEKQVYCFREVDGRQTASPFQATKEFRTSIAWYLWKFVLDKTHLSKSTRDLSSVAIFCDERYTEQFAADFVAMLKRFAELQNRKLLEEELDRKKIQKRHKKRQKRQNAKKQVCSISINALPVIQDVEQPLQSAAPIPETTEPSVCIGSAADTVCSSNSTASEEGANEQWTRSGTTTTEAPDILTDEDGEETPGSWTVNRNDNYQAWDKKKDTQDAEEKKAIDLGPNKTAQDTPEEEKCVEKDEAPRTANLEENKVGEKKSRSAVKHEKKKAWREKKAARTAVVQNVEGYVKKHIAPETIVESEKVDEAEKTTWSATVAEEACMDTNAAQDAKVEEEKAGKTKKPTWAAKQEKKKAWRHKKAARRAAAQNAEETDKLSATQGAKVEEERVWVEKNAVQQAKLEKENVGETEKPTWNTKVEESRGWRKKTVPWSAKQKGEMPWGEKKAAQDTKIKEEKVSLSEKLPYNETVDEKEVHAKKPAPWNAKVKGEMAWGEKKVVQDARMEDEKVLVTETSPYNTQAGGKRARGETKAAWSSVRGKKSAAWEACNKSSTAKSSTDSFPLLQDMSPTLSKCSSAGSSPWRDSDNAWGLPRRRVSAPLCNFDDIMTKFRGIRTELNDPNGKYRGISNKGNRCYVIALMQALFLSTKFLEDLFDKQEEQSKVAIALRNHMARMFVSSEESIDIEGVLDTLPPGLNDGTQQDAMETVRHLFSELLESTSLFRGSSSIRTRCTVCGYSSTKQEIMQEVSLPCKENKSVEEILLEEMEPELLRGDNQWHCESCQCKVDAYRTWGISDAPDTLCVNLNRFRWENCNQVKDCTFVQLKPTLRVVDAQYQLYAFIVHSGCESIRGHYYTVGARSSNVLQWRTFDDQAVRAITRTSVGDYGRTTSHGMMENDVPYILFYKKA
eukprot:GEMP01003569.1.p1 GENE.GEMP01003569.1~~GEMP01003569.1.p1  ORF type:complete len:1245 (+),score=225.95 GEMP01003569.1:57-3791(+)